MSGLQIQPHSRRITALAVVGLVLVAASGFAAGLTHQLNASGGPSPFPPPQLQIRVADAIPEATPAANLEFASTTPSPRRHVVKDPAAEDSAPVDLSAVVAEAPPATDASTTAPAVEEPKADPNL